MKRHEADAVSLVFGLIFVGLAAGWALVRADLVALGDLPLAGPILLVAAGAIGLVVSLRRGRRERRLADQEPAEPADGSGTGEQETAVLQRPEQD